MDISKRWSRRCSVSALAVFAALATAGAQAECAQWVLPGSTTLVHSNGIDVQSSFHRQGSSINGTAAWTEIVEGDGETFASPHHGGLEGRIEGNRVTFEITWGNGPVGAYSGEIDGSGHLKGSTFDRTHPGNRATWFSSDPVKCLAAQQPQRRRTVRTLGKRRSPPAVRIAAVPTVPQSADICVSGFVWRAARPQDLVCVTPESRGTVWQENGSAAQRVNPAGAYGPNTCVPGFVWREAFDGDVVCVTPQRRDEVRQENGLATSRRVGG